MTKPKAVIYDIDKTLCDTSGIWHLAEEGLKTNNFEAFHLASLDCPPIRTTIADLNYAAQQGYWILLVTARDQNYRHITIEWMRRHFIHYDGLFMRSAGDIRPDPVVKYELLQTIRQTFDIVHAWEDNPEIVELWEREGIPVTVVRL